MAADTLVLVVEDEQDIAGFLRAYFRASGYNLVHVDPSDDDELLADVREHRPDCILLDVRLRGFSGVDAYRRLRADGAFSLIPIILVTADASAGVRASGVAAGIDGFVPKPFSVQALESLVADRVAKARRLAAQSGNRGLTSADEVQERLVDRLQAARLGGGDVTLALVRSTRSEDAETREAAGLHLAEAARQLLPGGAVIGRTTGAELAVVLPDLTAEAAVDVLETLLAEVPPPGGDTADAAVVGVASFPSHAATADELFMCADAALAEAIDTGRTIVVALR